MSAPSAPARVLHLLSGDRWAGAEVATAHLLAALAARGDLRVGAIVLNPGRLAERLAKEGVPVEVIPEAERGFGALGRAVRARARDADLLHAHRYKEHLLAALAGRPWVATQHGRPEPFRGRAALRMALYTGTSRLALRLSARRAIGVSREVCAWLERALPPARVVRIWNGIRDPAPAVSPPPWRARPMRVGALARLEPVKALDLAVDAVVRCPGLELEIVGDGPERAALEARARAAGERVRFVGFEANPLPRLARWRVLLVPSLHEGNPIGVLEALALGTPVLSADLPGVAEILDGRGGWSEPRRRADAWAETLARVASDAAEGERASAAGRARFLEAFTAERAAEATAALYREVLGRRSPA